MRDQNVSTVKSVTYVVYAFCNEVSYNVLKSYSYGELAGLFKELTGYEIVCSSEDLQLPPGVINIATFQRLIRRWVAKQA